eukprot:jgi/Bigna1/143934/aug1.82_g18642
MAYYKDVENSAEIADGMKSGAADVVIINADNIVEKFQVAVAANRALVAQKENIMETKALSTELLFNLSNSSNISRSLSKIGVSATSKRLLLVIFQDPSSESLKIPKVVGRNVPLEMLQKDVNTAYLAKAFKISDAELKLPGDNPLLDALVCRIAAKETRRGAVKTGVVTVGKIESDKQPPSKRKNKRKSRQGNGAGDNNDDDTKEKNGTDGDSSKKQRV